MPSTSTKKAMPSPGMKKTEASEKKMPEGQIVKIKMTSSGEMPIPQTGTKNSPVHNKLPENGGIGNQTTAKLPRGAKPSPNMPENGDVENQTTAKTQQGVKPSP